LGEQSASKVDAEGSTPSVLADVSVAEQPRHHLATVDRRVRLPPDTLFRPGTQRVWRPVCRTGETGSSPVQGADRLVEQPGVLAALTWRRSLVRIQPGRLMVTPVAQRRRHPLDVGASSQVRVLPGVPAEWTGAWLPARSHKPSDAGSNPASATRRPGTVPGR